MFIIRIARSVGDSYARPALIHQLRQGAVCAPVGVEISIVQPLLHYATNPGPFVIQYRVPGRVADFTFEDHVIVRDTLEAESEAFCGLPTIACRGLYSRQQRFRAICMPEGAFYHQLRR